MPTPSTADVLDALQRLHLLDPTQLAELPRLRARFTEPRALARELLRRGWLTPFQANQLCQGRAAGLLLGSYLLLEPLGAGGMGRVFKARSRKLGKVVALKVLRKERLASPNALPRFEREIRAAAQLDHPNVVHAYDAEQAGGTHFLVLEHVDGTDLDRLVKERGPLPVAEACDYVRQAALGLQHAHEHGMIHRDVKPSNLLLGPGGVVKLLDLGLARLHAAADADDDPTLTQEGQVMGTADYVAPEQALSSRTADIRSDLYSLGGTFYYLLTGQVPIPGGTTLEKLVRLHVETPVPVEQRRPEVPPAVAAVVRRLMARVPADRYQTPAELAQALAEVNVPAPATARAKRRRRPAPAEPAAPTDPFEGLVTGDTVETSASNSALRRRPAPRRWPLVAGAGGAACFFLLLAVGTLLALRRPPEAPVPPVRPANGRLVLRSDVANARVLVTQGNAEVAALGFQGAAEAELKPGTYTVQVEGGAGARLSRGQVVLGSGARETVQVTAEPVATLGAWALVSRPAPLLGVRGWTLTTRSGGGPVRALAHDPRGRWLATSNQDGVVRLVDARRGELVRALVGHAAAVRALAWSPDGERLASVDDTGVVRLWQADSGKTLAGPPTRARGVAWSPDGRTLALVAEPGVVCWDVGTGKVARTLRVRLDGNSAVAWAPGGRLIALSVGKDVQLLPADGGKPPASLAGHRAMVRCLAWSPDGKALASGSTDRTVRVWDVAAGALIRELDHPDLLGPVAAVAWSPDGKRLACGGAAAKAGRAPLFLWDVPPRRDDAPWRERKPIDEPRRGLVALAWLPDSRSLAAGGGDAAVRCWEVASGKRLWQIPGHEEGGGPVAWSPDGKYLASVSPTQGVRFWESGSGRLVGRASPAGARLTSPAWSPDGQLLAAARADGRVVLIDAPSGGRERTLAGPAQVVTALAWSPDGGTLASGGADRTVRLWDTVTLKPVRTLGSHAGPVRCLAWLPDGSTLASAGDDRAVRLWRVTAGPDRQLDAGAARVRSLAWSPDGKRLAWAAARAVRVWEAATGALRDFKGHTGEVAALAWQPGGQTLASLGDDATARLWDVASGAARSFVPVPERSAAFSPDGRLLAGGGLAHTLRLWDVATGQARGTVAVLRQGELVLGPDGSYRAPAALDAELVYVVESERGQETLSPTAFARAYGWTNDPDRVRLLPPTDRVVRE